MAISKRRKKKYLPPEIVTAIFARLPLETLGSVILVNKFCLRLISTPAFAIAHLKYSKQGKINLSAYKLLFGTSLKAPFVKQISFESLLSNSSSINVVNLDYPKYELCSPEACFKCSCYGIVCVVLRGKHVFLWNPCTGKYKKLPRLFPYYGNVTYGLGYDESTDDFKVVALCSNFWKNSPKDWSSYELYVFSLRRDSWKKIVQDLECNVPEFDTGNLICEKLHWLSGARKNDETRKIVSFDVESEVFGIVEPPSNYEESCSKMTLDVLEGCICLLMSYKERKHVDLWVLKEYGVKESWTKVVTISCVGIPDSFICSVAVLPNGEIIFYSARDFVVYNLKENSFGPPGKRILDRHTAKLVFYVPSLVSPVV